ncbi:MAG: 3-hydroxyacyl-CoA dehydrogenase NAD-binding domain-containing protein [Candidatus Didemnitutus sp.]|nr:3-hydroxyacyl-CoA dehydrogenase NAD-binding domain-containing protein [Candidatus Didemnitutus sp.]
MNISLSFDAAGLATLTFDRPNSSANVFDLPTLAELDAHLATIESRADASGVLLVSAKSKIFVAGADLNSFVGATAEQLANIVDQGHRIFGRLENLKIPTVAAVNGVCLGGGCELVLACDWRVGSLDKSTKIGLPETQLGILPAWGGSVRLARLIGLPQALGIILAGKQLVAQQAQKIGLFDEIAHPEYLVATARKFFARGKRRTKPAGGLMNSVAMRPIITLQARKGVMAKTRGHYPAPLKALDVVVGAMGQPLAQGLALERAAVLALAQTSASRNLMSIFFLQERAKKLKIPGVENVGRPVQRVAVVGAGVMGAGIAQWTSSRGYPTLLKDIAPEALAKGLKTAEKIYAGAVKRRKMTVAEATAAFDRITATHVDVPLTNVDLVIEAAVEKLELKQKIFQQLEARAAAHTVLATNTSALSIDAIAGGLQDPGRVVGIHFFNPVNRMQLVEVVRGARTSDAALDTALTFVKAIGKLPVLVNDSPGFLVNRILLPYMVEAVRIFNEGIDVQRLDRIMLDFGMPMGPARLSDEVGLDVAQHVAVDLQTRLPKPVPINDTLVRMIDKGWLGKKSGTGFYVFPKEKGAKEQSNPALGELQTSGKAQQQDDATLVDRMVLVMINEAARCLEEGVVDAPEDVDFGMIFGTGWAPFRGGPLRYADTLGSVEIVKRLERLQAEVAPYFEPCAKLREMARTDARFYSTT